MEPGKPDFNYLPFKVHNGIVYLAGQLAKENGLVKNIGRVLEEISEDEERKAQDDVQKITDRFIAKVEEAVAAKEKDLLEI